MMPSIYRFDRFELDPAARELRESGDLVSLPPKSFECLVYLIENRDRAVGRDELISAVWGRVDASDAVVSQTLLRARKAIGDTGELQSCIRTVPRFGYHWVAPVEVVAPLSPDLPADPVAPMQPAQTDALDTSRSVGFRWLPLAVLVGLGVVGIVLFRPEPAPPPEPVPVTDSAPGTSLPSNLMVVLPVEVQPESPEVTWVRLGAMDFLASHLRRVGGLTVMPAEQALSLVTNLGATNDNDELTAQVRDRTGARWVVQPSVLQEADDWRFHLVLTDGESSRDFEAAGKTPLAAAAVVSNVMLERMGRGNTTVAAPTVLEERLQRIDAELLAGQLAPARSLVQSIPGESRDDPQVLVREGQLEFRAGQFELARQLFEGLILQASALPADVRVKTHMGLGAVSLRTREFEESERHYDQAIAELGRGGLLDREAVLQGHAYNGRGVSRVELGDIDGGIADLGRARIAMEQAGDAVEAATVSVNLGLLESRRGNGQRAIQEYDSAIPVFERYGVQDNLAATLSAKARTELGLVRPTDALESINQAAALSVALENPRLLSVINQVHVAALLANGLLTEAESQLGTGEPEPGLPLLRLRLEQGAFEQATSLAQQLLDSEELADSESVLLAVQAALSVNEVGQAQHWLGRLPPESVENESGDSAAALARALVASNHPGQESRANDSFQQALTLAVASHSPSQEVRVAAAWTNFLIEQQQLDRASELMGRYHTYVSRDYRLAKVARGLFTALGDEQLALQAGERLSGLAGERELALPPIY